MSKILSDKEIREALKPVEITPGNVLYEVSRAIEQAIMQKQREQQEPLFRFIDGKICAIRVGSIKEGSELFEHPPVPANSDAVFIVFDGPPDQEGPRFVEVETAGGISVRAGEWNQYGDYWKLGPLYLHPTPSASEGMVLVPIEPTEAMLAAITSKHDVEFYGQNLVRAEIISDYKAMLAAARSEK